jgi:hypothetical protein
LTGVAGELFHVAVEVVTAEAVVSTVAGRLVAMLASDEPEVPWYSSSNEISSLLSDAELMISTVASCMPVV